MLFVFSVFGELLRLVAKSFAERRGFLRRFAPNNPHPAGGILCKSFIPFAHSSKLGLALVMKSFAERRGFLRRFAPNNPHPAGGILCKSFIPFAHSSKLGLALVMKALRRDGDSNPGNPFGVYTLSRRASSTTRASLLRPQ